MTRSITFLSDYGPADEFVGVVHAVIATSLPRHARVIDLGHGVAAARTCARGALRARARAALHARRRAPGRRRPRGRRRAARGRAAHRRARTACSSGPTTGCCCQAAERFGGVAEAVEISASPWRLEPVSATFHGRDCSRRSPRGSPPASRWPTAGEPLDPDELVRLEPARAACGRRQRVIVHVVEVDGFGNVHARRLRRRPRPARCATLRAAGAGGARARTFADVAPGELLLYEDAGGALALAVNGGSAARSARRARPATSCAWSRRERSGARGCTCARSAPPTTAPASSPTAGAPHGTLVTADEQTAGRGRQGRAWVDAARRARSLRSLVLREFDALLPLRAGLAVADVAGAGARVKWPNDVLVDGPQGRRHPRRGRARSEGWAVLGIGVNVAASTCRRCRRRWRDRRHAGPPAGPSSRDAGGAAAARSSAGSRTSRGGRGGRDCASATPCAGAPVRWAGGEGVGAGIAPDGSLRVRLADGTETRVSSGEVLRRDRH